MDIQSPPPVYIYGMGGRGVSDSEPLGRGPLSIYGGCVPIVLRIWWVTYLVMITNTNGRDPPPTPLPSRPIGREPRHDAAHERVGLRVELRFRSVGTKAPPIYLSGPGPVESITILRPRLHRPPPDPLQPKPHALSVSSVGQERADAPSRSRSCGADTDTGPR